MDYDAIRCVLICLFSLYQLSSGGKNGLEWKKEEMDVDKINYIQELENSNIEITIIANVKFIKINVGKYEIWSEQFPLVRQRQADILGRYASVLAVILNLDSKIPEVKTSRKFMTGQPSESHKLISFMKCLQDGRLGILIGTPDFLKNMMTKDIKYFEAIGSRFLLTAERNDHWVLVWTTKQAITETVNSTRVWTTKLATRETVNNTLANNKTIINAEDYLHFLEGLNHRYYDTTPKVKILTETLIKSMNEGPVQNSVYINLYAPMSYDDFSCPWENNENMKLQLDFCRKYDGYDSLCSCENTYIPTTKIKPKSIPMKESIPIAIVTANKPHNLYRILRNLDIVWGSAETPVLVVIDGYHDETIKLIKLFKYDFKVHRPQGNVGDNTRVNMNIGFSAFSVFDHFPQYNKAIILEDDLLLSPDLLSFFHQTSDLLDKDETLSHVNAFGQNSYPLTAADLSTILRAEMYPQYGWMTTRRWFNKVSSLWVYEGKGVDWDWWLFTEGIKMDFHSIVPEVARTAHAGSAGAHVSGFRQFYYFTTRILSNSFQSMPILHTQRISPKENYDDWMETEIKNAVKIKLIDHPCDYNIFPKNESGPFVLFVGAAARDDKTNAFYLMQSCLGTDETDLKEIYDGVMRLNVLPYSRPINKKEKRRILYIVGCPLSSLCSFSIEIVDWIYPPESMLENLPNKAFFRKYISI